MGFGVYAFINCQTPGRSTVSKKVTGLSKGKTYYVRVRAYKTVNGVKVYGAYSGVKKVKL